MNTAQQLEKLIREQVALEQEREQLDLQIKVNEEKINGIKAKRPPKPILAKTIEIMKLQDLVTEYIDYMWSPLRHEDRDGKYVDAIFEKTVETFYGPKVFEAINKITA